MMRLTLLCAAVPLLAAAMISPAAAGGAAKASPVGSWQTVDGQARVRVTMCGDGTALCAVLTRLSGEARTPQNIELLNSYVVEEAQRADTDLWQGVVHFNGETARGKIHFVSANSIVVSGCQLGMCRSVKFTRV